MHTHESYCKSNKTRRYYYYYYYYFIAIIIVIIINIKINCHSIMDIGRLRVSTKLIMDLSIFTVSNKARSNPLSKTAEAANNVCEALHAFNKSMILVNCYFYHYFCMSLYFLCILVFSCKRGMLLESTKKLNEVNYYVSARNICNFFVFTYSSSHCRSTMKMKISCTSETSAKITYLDHVTETVSFTH
jgi:hypothetical protein